MRVLGVWLAALATLTLASVGWLWATGTDPQVDFSGAILLAGYAPLLAALLAVGIVERGAGLRAFGRQFLRWRVAPGWYLAVIGGPVLLVLLAILVGGRGLPDSAVQLAALAPALGSFVAGSLGEEPGWRGLAHPTVRRRLPLVPAGLVVGVIWAAWHQWILLAPGATVSVADVGINTVRLIATAVVYGWLYEITGGSLPLVMVAHLGHNLAVALWSPTTLLEQAVIACGYVLVAFAVVLAPRSRRGG